MQTHLPRFRTQATAVLPVAFVGGVAATTTALVSATDDGSSAVFGALAVLIASVVVVAISAWRIVGDRP